MSGTGNPARVVLACVTGQVPPLGCGRPERGGSASWNEALHPAAENSQTRNRSPFYLTEPHSTLAPRDSKTLSLAPAFSGATKQAPCHKTGTLPQIRHCQPRQRDLKNTLCACHRSTNQQVPQTWEPSALWSPLCILLGHEWFVMREMRNLNGRPDSQSQLSRSRTTPPS